ncbi:hypothetical protein JXD20_01555 [Candidatus Peregrinibacteria bacterium]|nr:hypothetical protein [Candidatus Peregrinibacteria bacterium]
MKNLSKLFITAISFALLAGCNLSKSEPVAPMPPTTPATTKTEVEVTEPVDVEVLDEEVETMMDEEAAIDAELDTLEAEEL